MALKHGEDAKHHIDTTRKHAEPVKPEPAPMAAPRLALAPPAAVVDDGKITLHLMDENEVSDHATVRVEAGARTLVVHHDGKAYQQVRPALDGWIYRHITK